MPERPPTASLNAEAKTHIQVYKAAEYYEVESLKNVAMAKYKRTEVDFKGAFDLMQSVYCATPYTRDPFREYVFAQVAERSHWLTTQPEFMNNIVTHPVMLSDLFRATVKQSTQQMAEVRGKLGETSDQLRGALNSLESTQETINNVAKCPNCPRLFPPRLKRMDADDACTLKPYCGGCGSIYPSTQDSADS